jgi:signal transduction histidine kinase
MLHSIRVRLLLTVGLVVVAALAAVALLSSRATRREFNQFVALRITLGDSTSSSVACGELEDYFRTHKSLEGSSTILRHLADNSPTVRGYVVTDRSGKVTDVSAPELRTYFPAVRESAFYRGPDSLGATSSEVILGSCDSFMDLRSGTPGERRVLRLKEAPRLLLGDSGQAIGRLLTVASPGPVVLGDGQFMRSVNRWLLAAVFAVGFLALASTFLLSRRILRPVEELTSIARQMGRGDLSRRASVEAKDEIGELARTFNGMADGLARIERLRRNMVEDVAHELRTPLTNIRCQLEALQDGLLTADRTVIDSLHEEVMALNSLVENLQDLALAEAGQLRLAPQPFPLRPEIERVVRSMRPSAGGGAAEVDLALPEDLPPVLADPERFRQILRNLLSNAMTFTPGDGRITIEARPAPAPEQPVVAAREMVEIEVRDTGPGIAAADLPFVFERFYRADPSRQRATGGAGLGLAIAKQLVEAHGGRIRAVSEENGGACFLFTLPQGGSPLGEGARR